MQKYRNHSKFQRVVRLCCKIYLFWLGQAEKVGDSHNLKSRVPFREKRPCWLTIPSEDCKFEAPRTSTSRIARGVSSPSDNMTRAKKSS